jgi:hypothetical protein
MVLNHLGFGVEIETCVRPKYGEEARVGKARAQIEREHHQWFGGYLNNQYGLPAVGNGTHQKYPPDNNYSRWWITFDASIAKLHDHSTSYILLTC